MKAREIMNKNPQSCHPHDRVCEAIGIMKRYNCGAVPVTDENRANHLVGILTDRDITLKMCDEEKTCKEFAVESCMSKEVYFCYAEDDIRKVEELMKQHQIHRIPVTDNNGTLQGIISLADLAREAKKEKKEGRRELPEQDLAEIVEAIHTA